ncbi:MAG: CAP domain-containing protein [Bacteroidales bacterium]
MKRFLIIITILALGSTVFAQGQKEYTESKDEQTTCLTIEELQLYYLINQYREKKKLPEIPLSRALTTVAQIHARDLAKHYKTNTSCNLHSWSSDGNWTECCYTRDHSKAKCMWDKPRELTDYLADGYEIAFYTTYPEELKEIGKTALNKWKKSLGHRQVIINEKAFKDAQWNAIGVGIYNGYVCVWFGMDPDPNPSPQLCE